MTRIRIEDLPQDTELTPEQEEQIQGAGLKSFKPSIESLEGREMYAANLASALPPVALSAVYEGQHGTLVHQITLENEMVAEGTTAKSGGLGSPGLTAPTAALDAALWGGHGVSAEGVGASLTLQSAQDIPLPPGVPPVSGTVTWGQWQNTDAGGHRRSGTGAGGVNYVEDITKDSAFTRTTTYTQGALQGQKKEEHWATGLYNVKVWNSQGWLILEGRESAQNHNWTVRKWDGTGVLRSTEVYDKVGAGQKLVSRETLAPGANGTFTEETWGANGRYVKNVWTKREHGDADSKEHISETIWEGSKATVTLFHKSGYYEVSSNGWGIGGSNDAKVTYVYSVDASGKVQEWLEYHVQEMDPSYKGWGISWVKHHAFPNTFDGWYPADGYTQPDGSKWGAVNSWTMAKFGLAPTQLAYTNANYTWLSRDH